MSIHNVDFKRSSSQGSISAFVVCLTTSLLILAGLVFDGGRVIARYAELADVAENAARIGAQQIVGIRAGQPRLNESAANRRIQDYLRVQHVHGSVAIQNGGAIVEVRDSVQMFLLSLIGIRDRNVVIMRESFVVSG